LAPSDQPGEIKVSAYEEGDSLKVSVSDNGVGMTADKKTEIFGGLSDPSRHFGLHSVNERIQLHYGHQFGLSIRSQEGEGTEITVTVPLRKSDETGGRTDA
jgi:two-component system sensor histidine kinase YesM